MNRLEAGGPRKTSCKEAEDLDVLLFVFWEYVFPQEQKARVLECFGKEKKGNC